MPEAMLSIALCAVMCLWCLAVFQLIEKKEELMKSFEEEINKTWEEIYASLAECNACSVTEEEKPEDPS